MHRTRVFGRQGGFSLIELIVVMAIMAMMALIATPWFIRIYQRNQLKGAAREIQTTLLAARMTAVKLNQQVSVVISSAVPPLQFQTIQPPPPAPTPTPAAATLSLPGSAAQFYATPNAAAGRVTFGGDGRVVNFPTTPAIYSIEGPVGMRTPNRIEVRVWTGGRVEVTPTVWQ